MLNYIKAQLLQFFTSLYYYSNKNTEFLFFPIQLIKRYSSSYLYLLFSSSNIICKISPYLLSSPTRLGIPRASWTGLKCNEGARGERNNNASPIENVSGGKFRLQAAGCFDRENVDNRQFRISKDNIGTHCDQHVIRWWYVGRHVRTIHQGALPLNALRSATTSFTGVAGRKAFRPTCPYYHSRFPNSH